MFSAAGQIGISGILPLNGTLVVLSTKLRSPAALTRCSLPRAQQPAAVELGRGRARRSALNPPIIPSSPREKGRRRSMRPYPLTRSDDCLLPLMSLSAIRDITPAGAGAGAAVARRRSPRRRSRDGCCALGNTPAVPRVGVVAERKPCPAPAGLFCPT
jgi:hypothetical protein